MAPPPCTRAQMGCWFGEESGFPDTGWSKSDFSPLLWGSGQITAAAVRWGQWWRLRWPGVHSARSPPSHGGLSYARAPGRRSHALGTSLTALKGSAVLTGTRGVCGTVPKGSAVLTGTRGVAHWWKHTSSLCGEGPASRGPPSHMGAERLPGKERRPVPSSREQGTCPAQLGPSSSPSPESRCSRWNLDFPSDDFSCC